ELESKISQFQIIDPAALEGTEKVVFSATVTIEDVETGIQQRFQIVGNDESDTKNNRISIASPIARAMIGKTIGDVAEVQAPGGVSEYEIIDIEYI
ncbi:GreA/GreB family elongation factor, partial [Turicimonas muris]